MSIHMCMHRRVAVSQARADVVRARGADACAGGLVEGDSPDGPRCPGQVVSLQQLHGPVCATYV